MYATAWMISRIMWKERNQTKKEYKLYGFIFKNSPNYKLIYRDGEQMSGAWG